jgi:hypothetical protein
MGTIILSALVAHTAWHWLVDRWGQLRQFPFPRPVMDAAFLAAAMRWAMVVVALCGVVWLVSLALRKRSNKAEPVNVGD